MSRSQRPRPARWLLVAGLIAAAAPAQEFELDLTGDSRPSTPAALRPSLVVLEVVASDAEAVSISRAKQLEVELTAALSKGAQFLSVVAPGAAKEALGALPTACADFACFQAAAHKLKVHRAVRVTVQKQGVGSLVTLVGFDPALPQLVKSSLDSEERAEKAFFGVAGKTQAQKDKEFLKKMVPLVDKTLQKLATPNGTLVVESGDPSVRLLLDGEPLGQGRTEQVVQRGAHTVSIDNTLYEPFSKDVNIDPLKTATVAVKLVARPVEVKKGERSTGTSLFKRPGLSLALAGAVAAGVGAGLGASSQAVKQRLAGGEMPSPVTRAEAQSAAAHALLANVLMGVGGAAVAGGVVWIVLTPAPVDPNALEPTDTAVTGPSGLSLAVGGSF